MAQMLVLRNRRIFCFGAQLPHFWPYRVRCLSTFQRVGKPKPLKRLGGLGFAGAATNPWNTWVPPTSRPTLDPTQTRRRFNARPPPADPKSADSFSNSVLKIRGGVDAERKDGSNMNARNGGPLKFINRQFRKGAGGVLMAMGFVSSATTSLLADNNPWRPSVDAIRDFLKTTGIESELSSSLNRRVFNNLVILARIQRILLAGSERRYLAKLKGKPHNIPTDEEALRYMRFATAAYGESVIQAAELEVRDFDVSSSLSSSMRRTSVAEHVGVPEEDLAIMDVDHSGDTSTLRHFVAVDHSNEKVVLAIRGTFSLSEIIKDVAGFSRPFCGGEAHSEIANMAEKVWERAGETVLQLLDANKNYEFVITGHSLGGGTACLLNILCHRNNRELVHGHKVRCFAYASPPVFTPLEFAPQAVRSCAHFIHEVDTVPFLSVDSVRRLLAGLRAIDKGQMGWWTRMSMAAGRVPPPPALIKAVEEAAQVIQPKEGAPLLKVPAASTLWMSERESGTFDAVACDSVKLASLGILVDPNMWPDHFPSRYEYALHHKE